MTHVHQWSQPYRAVDGNQWRECYLCRATEQTAAVEPGTVGPWVYGLDLLDEA